MSCGDPMPCPVCHIDRCVSHMMFTPAPQEPQPVKQDSGNCPHNRSFVINDSGVFCFDCGASASMINADRMRNLEAENTRLSNELEKVKVSLKISMNEFFELREKSEGEIAALEKEVAQAHERYRVPTEFRDECLRTLENAVSKASLTCGAHPGMSCREAHEDDALQIASLEKALDAVKVMDPRPLTETEITYGLRLQVDLLEKDIADQKSLTRQAEWRLASFKKDVALMESECNELKKELAEQKALVEQLEYSRRHALDDIEKLGKALGEERALKGAYREVAFNRSIGKGVLPASFTWEAIDAEAQQLLKGGEKP